MKIGAEFSIEREPGDIDHELPSLASALVTLSETIHKAHDLAIDLGSSDVASELVLIAHAVATLIPRALKQEIKS